LMPLALQMILSPGTSALHEATLVENQCHMPKAPWHQDNEPYEELGNKKEYFRRLLLMYKEWFGEVSFVYIDAFEFLE